LNSFVFNKPNITSSNWLTFLGSYIGGIISGLATLVAVIISLNISRNIQAESELRENSLIIYYDLILGSNDLKRLYINSKNKEFMNIPSRMFFSKEWIKNVAKISCNIRDTDKLYKLYTDLEIVGQELKSKSELLILKDDDFDNVRYEEIIDKISTGHSIHQIPRTKKLRDYVSLYKIEIHVYSKIYWIICHVSGNKVPFLRIKSEEWCKRNF